MKKTPKKSSINRFALCFVAILMCFSLAGGTYLLLDHVLPKDEQSQQDPDRDKKNWEAAGAEVPYLDGAGTKSNPWKISSAEDWAFWGNTIKTLKEEKVQDSAMAVAQALSGENIEMVVASAKARAAGEISATAFSVEDAEPATAYITVKKTDAQVSALSSIERQNPENLVEEHLSVVRANWATYSSSSYVNNFELSQDLDLSEYRWMPIANLEGNFDGGGHTIDLGTRTFTDQDLLDSSIVTIDEENNAVEVCIGLFGTISGGDSHDVMVTGEIRDEYDESDPEKGDWHLFGGYEVYFYIGGKAGKQENGQLSHIVSKVIINKIFKNKDNEWEAEHACVGGIVGRAKHVSISFCYNKGIIWCSLENEGAMYEYCAGGIAGFCEDSCSIWGCGNYGFISHLRGAHMEGENDKTPGPRDIVGGIVGYLAGGSVRQCMTCVNQEGGGSSIIGGGSWGGIEKCVDFLNASDKMINGDSYDTPKKYHGKLPRWYETNPWQIYTKNTGNEHLIPVPLVGSATLYVEKDGKREGLNTNTNDADNNHAFAVGVPYDRSRGWVNDVNTVKLTFKPYSWYKVGEKSLPVFKIGDKKYYFTGNNISVKVENAEEGYDKISGTPKLDNVNGDAQISCIMSNIIPSDGHDYNAGQLAPVKIIITGGFKEYYFEQDINSVKCLVTTGGSSGWTFSSASSICDAQIGLAPYTENDDGTWTLTDPTPNTELFGSTKATTVNTHQVVAFKVTPKVGYGVVGVYGFNETLSISTGGVSIDGLGPPAGYKKKDEMDDADFKTKATVTDKGHLVLLSNYYNTNKGCDGLNNLHKLGDVSGLDENAFQVVAVTPENYQYFKYIYVCLKELTYKVEQKFIVGQTEKSGNTWYLQKTGNVTVKDLTTTYNARTFVGFYKNNASKLTITLTDGKGKQYYKNQNKANGILKSFGNLSEDNYNSLMENLNTQEDKDGLKNLFRILYGDIIGGFINDNIYLDTDSISGNTISSFCMVVTIETCDTALVNPVCNNFCDYWYDLYNQNVLDNWHDADDGGTISASLGENNGDDNGKITVTPTSKDGYALDKIEHKKSWDDSFSEMKIDKDGKYTNQLTSDEFYDHLAADSRLAHTILEALKDGTGIFNKLSGLSKSSRQYKNFKTIITIQYRGYFALQQFDFQGEVKGGGSVSMKTYENNPAGGNDAIFSTQTTQKIYYNTPVILIATPNENCRFVGWYLGGSQDVNNLLSTNAEFHFVWDAGEHGNETQTLQITAVFESYSKNVGKAPEYVNGVYQITSADNLVWLSNQVATGASVDGAKPVSEHMFKLVNDIDMRGVTFDPIGTEKNPFKGIFDGNFKQIKNLKTFSGDADTMNDNLLAGRGLFGYTDGAIIKNVVISGKTAGYGDVGLVAGHAKNTTFSRVEVSSGALTATQISYVDVYGSGRNANWDKFSLSEENKIEVQNHKAQFIQYNFAARENFGGLVGYAEGCSFVGCSNRANLNSNIFSNGGDFVAGLVGRATASEEASTTIDQCFNMATVNSFTDTTTNEVKTTNMLANGDATITNCYYGNITLETLDDLSDETSGVVGLKMTEGKSDYSDIWGILNGKLVLKIFYWI